MNRELYRTLARNLCDRDVKYQSVADLEDSLKIVGQAIRLAEDSRCTLEVPKGKRAVVAGSACWGEAGVKQGPLHLQRPGGSEKSWKTTTKE